MSDPETAADTPLLHVLSEFDAEGFQSQFQAADGGAVLCLTCRVTSPADAIHADRMVRLEGASDPADMLAVIPVTCPACGARGTLVCNYGPESTVEEAELLLQLERSPARAVAEETARVDPT